MNLKRLRERVNVQLAKAQSAQQRLLDEQNSLRTAKKHLKRVWRARSVIQAVAEHVQQQAHTQIARIVTRCLQAVMGKQYAFKIRFEQKRGRTEAYPKVLKAGIEIDPLEGSGGGLLDVVSFALRVACLILARPQRRKLIILDEPFKFVSPEYRANVAILIQSLAEEMGVQFVIVTHMPELFIGKVIRV